MQSRIVSRLLRLSALALIALPLGCGGSPEPLPPKVATGLDTLRNEAVALKGQIEKVTVALTDMMAKPQADLGPQNASYSMELAVLEGRLERAQAQRQVADRMVNEQFATWDRQLDQLQSEESREMAAERRAATAETFSGIQQQIDQLRERFAPFLTDLKDVRQYLKGDLSTKGLETMKPTAERIFGAQAEVQGMLDAIITSITAALG